MHTPTAAMKENFERTSKVFAAANTLNAFRECSDELQKCVLTMVDLLSSGELDQEETDRAVHTIAECLFPEDHGDACGIALEDVEAEGAKVDSSVPGIAKSFDEEEQRFADKLGTMMKEKNLSQVELAKRAGVGQPAIANMLKRECRPQRRTVEKLAKALDTSPAELWPVFNEGTSK